MTKWARLIKILLLVIVLLPVVAIILYDLLVVRPYLHIAMEIVARSPDAQRHPPENIRRMVYIAYGQRSRLRIDTINTMIRELNIADGGNLRRHTTGALWQVLAPLHMSDEDTLALWCSLRPSSDLGLSGLATMKYGKELGALNEEETAAVVVMTMAPRLINTPDDGFDYGLKGRVRYLIAKQQKPEEPGQTTNK